MNLTSTLDKIIQQAWSEPSLSTAQQLVIDYLSNTRVKDKDSMIAIIRAVPNKRKLDSYLANSLLKFEGMSTQLKNPVAC